MTKGPYTTLSHYQTGELRHKMFFVDGDMRRRMDYHKDGHLTGDHYYKDGKLHCEDGPAMINYFNYGDYRVMSEFWYMNDRRHNEHGPAIIHYEYKGAVKDEYWFLDGKEFNINRLRGYINLSKAEKVEMKLVFGK